MKKLLILGSDMGTTYIIQYAKNENIYTIVSDDRTFERSYAKQIADEYWMISTTEIQLLAEKCRKEEISGIICGASDFNTDRLLELSEATCLPCYTNFETWKYSRNKGLFKHICEKVGAPVAQGYYCQDYRNPAEIDKLDIVYPVVVKPVDLSGSRGVSYCYNREELNVAIDKAYRLSVNPELIIERKLNGKEFVAYYAVAEGELSLFAFHTVNNHHGVSGPCDVIDSTATNYLDLFVQDCDSKLRSALKQCGVRDNIVWVQLLLDEDTHFYVIEIGQRFGGDMTVVPFSKVNNFNAVKWSVECAMGKKHTISELPVSQNRFHGPCACAYRIRVNKIGRISGFTETEHMSNNGIQIMYSGVKGDHVFPYRVVATALINADSFKDLCRKIKIVNDEFKVLSGDENLMMKYESFEVFEKESFHN